jgi:F0F1-type ATP synthase membrane subunit c/vacuolar-type H+-ATPase subunit K
MRNYKFLVLISIALALVVSLAAPSPALAQGNADGGVDPGAALSVLENTFKNLGILAIKFMYTLSFIIMLVGGVKNGFAINVAQQIGVAGMASRHTWNFIMGILVFVLFLATLPILNLVINNVTHLVPSNIDIYTPSW